MFLRSLSIYTLLLTNIFLSWNLSIPIKNQETDILLRFYGMSVNLRYVFAVFHFYNQKNQIITSFYCCFFWGIAFYKFCAYTSIPPSQYIL